MNGIVREIYIGSAEKVPLQGVREARVVAGQGVDGDRYALGTGAFSRWPGPKRQVSFINAEAIAAVRTKHAIDLANGRHRRNLVIEGIDLPALNGRRFRIGEVLFRGVDFCLPCAYLERLLGHPLIEALKGYDGLRAEVLEGGILHVGDRVEVLEETEIQS
jgi:MOSC domain-containing protein YiiM